MKRRTLAALVGVGLLGMLTAEAGLWNNIYRGLDYAATPTGSPIYSASDGTRINGARSGRLRIVPNGVVGKGYRLEFDRSFGVDSTGRPETMRFGCCSEMTLQGSTQATASYSRCGDKFLGGDLTFTTSNLGYDVRTKLGAQDVEISGVLNAFGGMEANMAGFYQLNLNVSHASSQIVVDGLLVRDEQDANFDVGPISVKGNIYADILAATLASYGIELPWYDTLFPDSPVSIINEAYAAQAQAERADTDALPESDFTALLLQSVFAKDEAATQALVAAAIEQAEESPDPEPESAQDIPATVPEPGTLLLVALGSTMLVYSHRRR